MSKLVNAHHTVSLEAIEGFGISEADAKLAMWAFEILTGAYPGYNWAVNASYETGMLDIRCAQFPMKYGYSLHLHGPKASATASEMWRQIKHAGGEILERHGATRGAVDWDQIRQLPTDSLGEILGDLS